MLIKKNVGVVEFAESPDYCGGHLFPRQRTLLKLIFLEELSDYDKAVIDEWQAGKHEVILAPYTMERYHWLKANGYPHFRINQFIGGRRSGKGHVTGVALAYKVFKTQQIENPSQKFGIERGKDIYFSVIAAALDQAQAHQFGDVSNTLLNCKALIEGNLIGKSIATELSVYTGYDLRRKMALAQSGTRVDKDMASLRVKAHGSNARTIRGAATLAFVFDEMAHLTGGESRMSDEELWKAINPSLQQFDKEALIFANSSPYQKTGEFYRLYKRIMQDDELPADTPFERWPFKDHLMIQFPSWSMYKDWETDPYWTNIGAELESPERSELVRQEELADPESFKVEYRAQFAEVIDSFLRSDMVDRMYSSQYHLSTLGHDIEPTRGAIAFTRYKGHGDPSATGANFGIAVGHLEDVANEETGITEPHVVFDLIDAFYPKDFENETIDWLQVVPEITTLIQHFQPYEWTFDQFDNRMAIQQLTQNLSRLGLSETMIYQKPATKNSNMLRAKNFRAALNLGRVHAPHWSKFNANARVNSLELSMLELKFLQEKPVGSGHVEKQTIGPVQTKDIADCIMEVTDALIGDNISQLFSHLDTGPAFGAPHGYAIGVNPQYGNTDGFSEFGGWYKDTGAIRKGRGLTPRMPMRGRGYGQR